MSRSAAAVAQHERKLRRSAAPAVARRVSGPARPARTLDPRPRSLSSPRPLRVVAGGGAAIASRAAGLALGVSGSRAMDRLVRSRVWIVILGFGLIGIVTTQVSLLKLNAGIGRAVNATATLERANSALRLNVSQLSATDRIQRMATAKGFVMPAPVDVHYLRAGDLERDGSRAVKNMRAPQPGVGAQTPSAALPAVPQASSAVVASAAPKPTSTPAGPSTGTGGAAPATGAGVPSTGNAQPPAAAGGTAANSAAPSSSAGGIAPPTSSATTTGP